MQDFTKPFKLKNEVKQLELNIPNQPKVGFIASRMNKDNFWNLMFWLGMFLGFTSAALIDKQPISGIIGVVTLFGMPYLVKRNTDVSFDKLEQGTPMFIINGNKRVNATGIGFIALLVTAFLITAIIRTESKLTFFLFFWFIPALYCILRNLPITVYFKKEAWVGDGTVTYGSSSSRGFYSYSKSSFRSTTSSSIGTSCSSFRHTTSSSSRDSIITSPSYRWHPSNIYHRR
jgi:hypothetical protein